MELDSAIVERLLVLLFGLAGGAYGGRRIIKQDNAWDQLVKSQRDTINHMQEQIYDLKAAIEEREWKLEDQAKHIGRIEARMRHLEENCN